MSLLKIDRDGPITTLTIDRAETMNPLGAPGDGDEFTEVCNSINRDMIGLLRGVVLVGAMSILTWERPGLAVSIFIGIGLLTGWFAASWLDRNFRELVHKMLANVRSALPF